MSEDEARRIRENAIAALARREHSRVELFNKLNAKGFASELVDETLTQLAAENLQDDRRFAEAYIRHRYTRGFGPVRIKLELRERGIDEALSAEIFEELEIDWSACLDAAWRKKFKARADSFRERASQARFLQYRGFTHDQISRALDVD